MLRLDADAERDLDVDAGLDVDSGAEGVLAGWAGE